MHQQSRGALSAPPASRCALVPLAVRLCIALAAATLSCTGSRSDDEAREREAGRVDSSATTAAAADPADSTCVKVGLWSDCNVADRLERAGLIARRTDQPVRHDYLSVAGTAYRIGNDELQVFIYPSAEARERDSMRLDSTTAAPPGARRDWPSTPTLIVSNNLLAIMLSRREQQIERVQLALTAGLPSGDR
jgi:hypothetical protein